MADYGGPKQFGGSFLVIFQMLLEPNHIHSTYIYIYIYTSSTAQGGGGSFKNREPIGEVGCGESGMAERSH